MANDDKFAKTLDDENLDEVAGGTIEQLQKDLKFFKALGMAKENHNPNFEKQNNVRAMQKLWANVGVTQGFMKEDTKNPNYYITSINGEAKSFSRQDAMIYVMRKKNKYLNLEDFI